MATQLELCNNALDLVGQGSHINALTEESKEADLCNRTFTLTVLRALDKYNFSFARKDEVITEDYLLSDVVSLPYAYSYTLPSDVQRILFLAELDDDARIERIRHNRIQFNFRNYNGSIVLSTDKLYPFVVHYQAAITDPSIFPVTFSEAIEYLMASRMATALIHGTSGLQIAQALLQQGNMLLMRAADIDAQQGGDMISFFDETPLFIKARGQYDKQIITAWLWWW